MKRHFIKFMAGLLAALMVASLSGCAGGASKNDGKSTSGSNSGSGWPKKTLTIVVPFSAGGDTDFHARLYAKYLGKILGQSVVVTNVAGSNGTSGATQVKNSTADGYTALFFHDSMLMNKVVGVSDYDHTAFDICCGGVVDNSFILAVNANSPYKNLKDFINAAKEKPGQLKYASSVGGYTYYIGRELEKLTGAKFNIVDAGGGSDRNAALLAKKIDSNCNPYGVMKPYVEAKNFKVLCVFSDKRSDLYPDVPTAKEQGYDLIAKRVYFLAFPKGTDSAIIKKMNDAMKQISGMPEYKSAIEKSYCLEPAFMDTQETKTYLDNEMADFMKEKSFITGK